MVDLLHIDEASRTPIYKQLYDQIKSLIEANRLPFGHRLPPTREMAGTLGLNRTTVSAAYDLLEKDGLIRGHVGRGSFVAQISETNPSAKKPSTIINFDTSRPANDLFPLEAFRQSALEVLAGDGLESILQLGSPLGYEPLRRYLNEQNEANSVLITNGAQQALDLIQRALTLPGDLILVEDPVYPGVREIFHNAGARLLGVPVTSEGLDLDELNRAIRRERPKIAVLTPNFQNPTGVTLPLDSRIKLLEILTANGVTIVENDIYTELRYKGQPIPSLKQLDESGQVIQLGSFSKVSFPGLRVGWILAPQSVIARLAEAKQWADLHTDHLSQAILLEFALSGRLESHKRRVIESGRERLQATLEACKTLLPGDATFTQPEGGMNLWLTLPTNAVELLESTRREGVTFLPGKFFAVSRPHDQSLRLSFAGLDPNQIRQGIAVIAKQARAQRAPIFYQSAMAIV